MTTSKQTTQSSQSSQTQPYSPTIPLLGNIISQLQGVNTAPTATQNAAVNQIQSNADALPNLGPAANGLTTNLLSGLPNFNKAYTDALGGLNGVLSTYTNPNYLDPNTNPATKSIIDTVNQDVTNQVGSLFAGAGRALSPGETQAMSRGLSQGLSVPLFNQYNANVGAQQGAAGTMFNAANTTNSNILGNATTGLNTAGSLPTINSLGPLASLAASNLGFSLPLSQLGSVEGMTLPIAGLGSQSQGQGTQTTTGTPSLFSDILGGITGFRTLFPVPGAK